MGQEQANSIWSLIILLIVFGAIFYFLLIRPQRRREQEHRQLIKSLKRGDRVITAGGIYGVIDKIDDDTVILSLEEGAKVRVAKTSIVEKVRK
ncbi:MAG TPA: preprotein translocase subunit YajC [Candidatus Acetothermia bacterium]|nr:preprotein translocase subunit YajC [Candidatus Acetothermia bacterium]